MAAKHGNWCQTKRHLATHRVSNMFPTARAKNWSALAQPDFGIRQTADCLGKNCSMTNHFTPLASLTVKRRMRPERIKLSAFDSKNKGKPKLPFKKSNLTQLLFSLLAVLLEQLAVEIFF